MKKIHTIRLPHLGEGVESADVSEILVSPGDKINSNEPIVVLESDKATMEIPSDIKGTIQEVFIEEGKEVLTGDKIVSILSEEPTENIEKEEEKEEEKQEETQSQTIETDTTYTPTKKAEHTFRTSPSVRKLARELQISLSDIKGSGKKGRITREDLIYEIKGRMTKKGSEEKKQETDYSQWGPTEVIPLSKVKRITGTRMESAWREIPQVTQFDKADISGLNTYRKNLNKENPTTKITFLPFLIKAVTKALIKFPDLNSSLSVEKDSLIHKRYYNIGVAVDTPGGLVVPVVKNTNKKDIIEISKELEALSRRSREKQLKPEELKGGTFTISSLGGIGGTYFSPIVNPPQVAILGVSKAKKEPVFSTSKNNFVPKDILPLSLTYDHRVIDGAQAAVFTKYLGGVLSEFSQET